MAQHVKRLGRKDPTTKVRYIPLFVKMNKRKGNIWSCFVNYCIVVVEEAYCGVFNVLNSLKLCKLYLHCSRKSLERKWFWLFHNGYSFFSSFWFSISSVSLLFEDNFIQFTFFECYFAFRVMNTRSCCWTIIEKFDEPQMRPWQILLQQLGKGHFSFIILTGDFWYSLL